MNIESSMTLNANDTEVAQDCEEHEDLSLQRAENAASAFPNSRVCGRRQNREATESNPNERKSLSLQRRKKTLLKPSQTLAFEEEGNTKKAADSSPTKER